MAVQAQYPSNVLFLNRSIQETKNPLGNDYSIHTQQGGGVFLDQSHMLFNNGVGSNTRKRGREMSGTPTLPINQFSIHQSLTPQLINLSQSQLHNNQHPNVVSTGLRLAFGEQQQQQQLQQHHRETISPPSSSSVLFSHLSEDLATQIRQQRDEIDHFLHAQGEQLRRTLEEKRQRHYHALLAAAEESAARRLREKEAEVEKAARRNAELEARAAHLSAEAQEWRARAAAQEAVAVALEAQLQQAIVSAGCARREEDGGGVLGCAGGAEDAESACVDPGRVVVEASGGPSCKACRKRVASVVLLPCRHFCLCTECDSVAQACPVCLSFRNSSVEVFLS